MLTDDIEDSLEIYAVDIDLECPNCNEHISSTIEIGFPDFSAEQYRDSANEYDDETFCDHCGDEISLWVTSRYHECHIQLVSHPEIYIKVSSPYFYKPNDEYKWAKEYSAHKLTLNNQLNSIKNILEIANKESENAIYIMLFGHTVSCFEGYLQLTFIHLITNFDEIKQKFLLTNDDFKSEKVLLTELSKKPDYLNEKIQDYLENLTFHNISKISPIFNGALGFKFESNEKQWIGSSVNIRHDCVHRGGMNIRGEKIDITRENILDLLDKIYHFSERFENFLDESNLR